MRKNHVDRNKLQDYRHRFTRLFVLNSVATIVAAVGVVLGNPGLLPGCVAFGAFAVFDYYMSESGVP